MRRYVKNKAFVPPRKNGSKSSKIAINRQQLPGRVRDWWESKVTSGSLYLYPEVALAGDDYEGDLKWPTRASFLSLYHDFLCYVNKEINCTHGQFSHYLHKYTPLDAGTPKKVVIRTSTNEKLWEATRTMIEIPRIENARRIDSTREEDHTGRSRTGESTKDPTGAKWYPT